MAESWGKRGVIILLDGFRAKMLPKKASNHSSAFRILRTEYFIA